MAYVRMGWLGPERAWRRLFAEGLVQGPPGIRGSSALDLAPRL